MRKGFLFSGALALFAFALVIAIFAFTTVQTDLGAGSMTGYAVEVARYPGDLVNYTCHERHTVPGNAFSAVTGVYAYKLTDNETTFREKVGQVSLDVLYVKNHSPTAWFEEPKEDTEIPKDERSAFKFKWDYCDPDDDNVLFSVLYTKSAACSKDKPASCNWKLIDDDYYRFSSDTKTETLDLSGMCAGSCPKAFRIDAWDGVTNGSGYVFGITWGS